MKKTIAFICGLLMLSSPAVAGATNYKSGSYQLRNLNFGQEVALFSTDFVPPAITGEGPTVSDIKDKTVKVKWITDKESTSIVSYGTKSAVYDADIGKSSEYVKSHAVTVYGLNQQTTYYFIVKSTDKLGNIGSSAESSFTTKKSPGISSVQITDITLNSTIISFETITITNSKLKYGTTSDYGSQLSESSGSMTTRHSLKLDNLSQGTTYHFQVEGADEYSNTIYSDDYVFNTLPLPTVSNLRVEEITANTATVKWTTNSDTDALVKYWTAANVEIEGIAKGEKQTAGSPDRTKEHTIKVSPLFGDTVYNYQVLSQDAHSNRVESNEDAFQTAKDNVPPQVIKVKVKNQSPATSGSGLVQAIVTWETNELSTSQMVYGIGNKTSTKDKSTGENKTYTTNHYIILQDLAPASTYHVKAVSRDLAGNTGESGLLTILTPKKQRSLFQLILERLENTFGWIKKIKI